MYQTNIRGAFSIYLGKVAKSNHQRGEEFTPKGDVSTFDNFYYIFAKESRKIYDISAYTHTCNGFTRVLRILEAKYGKFSKYSPKDRNGQYYCYSSGNREITLRCDKYYGFPMATSYIDKGIKASDAPTDRVAEEVKSAIYNAIEKTIQIESNTLYDNL